MVILILTLRLNRMFLTLGSPVPLLSLLLTRISVHVSQALDLHK